MRGRSKRLLENENVSVSLNLNAVVHSAVGLAGCLVLLVTPISAYAETDSRVDYVKKNWAIFHKLFDNHNLRPSMNCQKKEEECERLLKKFETSDFKFIAPNDFSDDPNSSLRQSTLARCPDLDTVSYQLSPFLLKPTTGFALYALPHLPNQPSRQAVFLWRSEDYYLNGRITSDGLLTAFTFKDCKVFRRQPFEKSHKSEYAPDAPNQEKKWLTEPIEIDGRILILDFHALNNDAPKPPLYSMHLNSVLGNVKTGGEYYSFTGTVKNQQGDR